MKQLLEKLFVLLAILTSMGTLLNDMRANRAYALAVPLSQSVVNVTSNLDSLRDAASHTHVESISSEQVTEGIPRIQTRDDRRHYVSPKCFSRSGLYFGGSRILWPNV